MGVKVNRKFYRKNEFYFCNWVDVEFLEWEKVEYFYKNGY